MGKANKGGAFEREWAVRFSEWITCGLRDDVFWRSSASGARATARGKAGRTTQGQCGDIAATDQSWAFVTDAVSIELKRGYTDAVLHTLIDRTHITKQPPFQKFIAQTIKAQRLARTPGWLLVSRRDQKQTLWTMNNALYHAINDHSSGWLADVSHYMWGVVEVEDEKTEIIQVREAELFECVHPTAFAMACRALCDAR